jgi:hypothetical protein
LDWRTVKRYLSTDAPSGPPVAPSREGTVARKIDALAPVVDAWLAADPRLRTSVIHERLVGEHSFDGHHQSRPRAATAPSSAGSSSSSSSPMRAADLQRGAVAARAADTCPRELPRCR